MIVVLASARSAWILFMRYSQSSVLSRNPFPSTYSDISGILVSGDHGITTDLTDADGAQRGPDTVIPPGDHGIATDLTDTDGAHGGSDTVNPSTVDIFDDELETDLAGSPDITQRGDLDYDCASTNAQKCFHSLTQAL